MGLQVWTFLVVLLAGILWVQARPRTTLFDDATEVSSLTSSFRKFTRGQHECKAYLPPFFMHGSTSRPVSDLVQPRFSQNGLVHIETLLNECLRKIGEKREKRRKKNKFERNIMVCLLNLKLCYPEDVSAVLVSHMARCDWLVAVPTKSQWSFIQCYCMLSPGNVHSLHVTLRF